MTSLEVVNKHNCNSDWVLKGTKGNHMVFIGMRCKRWDCPYCGPRRLRFLRKRCEIEAKRLKLNKMMSLTLRPGVIGGYDVIKQHWAKFRARLKKRYPKTDYQFMAFMEPQKRGAAHLHVLHNLWIPQAWISKVWYECGGGKIVDVRYRDIHRVSHYLTDYLTKSFFMSIRNRSRRVTTSRGVSLKAVKKYVGYKWEILKYSFNQAFERFNCIGHLHWKHGDYFEVTLKLNSDSSNPPTDLENFDPSLWRIEDLLNAIS